MGYVRTCHSLRMHFCLFSLLFKGNFQNYWLIFRKCNFFLNFVINSLFPKIQNVSTGTINLTQLRDVTRALPGKFMYDVISSLMLTYTPGTFPGQRSM